MAPDDIKRPARPMVVRTVVAAATSTVLASLPVFLLGGLAVLIRRELGFGELQLGLAVTVFFAVAAVTAVPAGRLASRLGSWLTTVLAAVLSASALAGMALAPSYLTLVLALALAGVGNALAQIGSNHALAQVVPPARQGLAFGVKQAAVPGATLLAGLALPLLGLTVGWRVTLLAAALLALLYVVVAAPTGRPVAAHSGRRREGDAGLPPLAVVAVGSGLGAAAASALGAFLVESAVAIGLAPGSAGLLLAGGSAVAVVVRLLVGWWADSRERGLMVVVAVMLGAGAVGMALLATASVPAFVVGTVLAFGLGWSWPGLLTFAIVRLNRHAPAVATSITQTGVFAGGAAGPLLFGLLVESRSYQWAWSAAAIAWLIAAVFILVGRSMLVSERARRAADSA